MDADEGAAKRAAAGEAAAAAAAAYKPAVYVFREPTAGICFAPSPILVPQSHDGTERLSPPLVVSGFAGADCAAARSGVVKLGQVLLAVNGVKVVGMGFEATLAVLRDPRRPMRLDLGVNPDAELVVEREEGEGKACCLDVEVALFSLSSSAQQGQGEGGRVLGPAAGEELPLVVVTGLVANRPGTKSDRDCDGKGQGKERARRMVVYISHYP